MKDKIVERETHVHGNLWGKLYDGFFSDKRMAADYVAAIMRVARGIKPSAVADLGGGTGFILEQLVEAGIAEDIRMFNLDESDSQLAMCKHPRITPMRGAFQTFRRADILGEAGSLMVICRSVLHYAGIFGQKPWLNYLRGQMKAGEWFIHQSGCLDDVEAALALDVFFEMAGVDKWLPHREAFIKLLEKAGFEVSDDFPVPPLGMPSDVLAMRYNISPENLAKIEKDLRRTCSSRPDLFKSTPSGFVFNFPYRVFICRAVEQVPA